MESESKNSKRLLSDVVLFVFSALLMIFGPYIPGLIPSWIIEPLYNDSNGFTLQILWCVGSIIIALLLYFLFEKVFSRVYEGSHGLDGFGYGMKLLCPIIIFYALWMGIKTAMGQLSFSPLDFESIIKGLRPGVNEEILFRGIAVALLLRRFHSKKNIWIPVIFTSVVFGLTHYMNMISPDELPFLTVNAVFAAAFGMVFGIAFTLSGTIWPVLIVHSAYDIAVICSFSPDDAPDWLLFVDVGGVVLIMILLIFVFQKKRAEAAALWDRKWK